MESMVECMESIVEYMEQKHSTWNPPGMWGQGKVLAVEQDAMEELRKKRASLRKAVEEAQQKAREEAEVTAREANMREREEALAIAKAIRQAQEEREIQGKLASGPC